MATQTYENHRHNPRMTGIGFGFVLLAIVSLALRALGIGGDTTFAIGLAALIGANLVLLAISRAYTVRLQNRIIRLEMKTRCAQFLSAAQMAALSRLSMSQLVALRFASDEEMPALLDRAEREALTNDQIKRAIKTWIPDWDRT